MRSYRITSISSPVYRNDDEEYWRKACLENTIDSSDTKDVNLAPHAINEASGILLIDDIPRVESCFWYKEEMGKTLEEWVIGDVVFEW